MLNGCSAWILSFLTNDFSSFQHNGTNQRLQTTIEELETTRIQLKEEAGTRVAAEIMLSQKKGRYSFLESIMQKCLDKAAQDVFKLTTCNRVLNKKHEKEMAEFEAYKVWANETHKRNGNLQERLIDEKKKREAAEQALSTVNNCQAHKEQIANSEIYVKHLEQEVNRMNFERLVEMDEVHNDKLSAPHKASSLNENTSVPEDEDWYSEDEDEDNDINIICNNKIEEVPHCEMTVVCEGKGKYHLTFPLNENRVATESISAKPAELDDAEKVTVLNPNAAVWVPAKLPKFSCPPPISPPGLENTPLPSVCTCLTFF